MKKRFKKRQSKIIIGFTIILIGIIVFVGFYQRIFSPNVSLPEDNQEIYIYIPSDADYHDVIDTLEKKAYIKDIKSFKWVARKKNYDRYVQAGRYKIKHGMSNNQLVELLRSGRQEPVDLIFNNIRTKEELASRISEQIEADSVNIVNLLNDKEFLAQFNFTPSNVYAMIIPDTYEFWWNTKAKGFLSRMHKEYKKFWSDEKMEKAEKIELSPVEVSTLASIVDEETLRDEEMPIISGVYINRLEKGMRLQADPTVKFAVGDFSIKRVLNKHLEVDSPYNTYKNAGLPPGPISFPSKKAINSVLNYKEHDYLYFAAKPDFSGYHNFSETHYQHILNARKYQRALNKERIWE
jgi:UPF0755 protein